MGKKTIIGVSKNGMLTSVDIPFFRVYLNACKFFTFYKSIYKYTTQK